MAAAHQVPAHRAIEDLRSLASAALEPTELDAYAQTAADVLFASVDEIDAEMLRMRLALLDTLWRTRLGVPEATNPVRSAVVAGFASMSAGIALIASIVTLMTANVPLALLLTVAIVVALVGIGVTVWKLSELRRRLPKRRSVK